MMISNDMRPRSYFRRLSLLKKLFWVYFLLWIFEGALRKWIVPQLSAPLLLVRDPVSILIIWEAFRTRSWPIRWSTVNGALCLGLLGLCLVQLVTGDNSWFAAAYGLRSYLLPFPVLFIMGENLDRDDLHRLGTCLIWLMIPMTALEALQFLSPSSSWINAGASQGAQQITYVGDTVRASGSFSFVTGPTIFVPLVASFLLYSLLKEGLGRKWLVWAGVFALIISVPVIGSRTLVVLLCGTVACAGISAVSGTSQFLKVFKIAGPLLLIFGLVTLLPFFSHASQKLQTRFGDASQSEGTFRHALAARTIGGEARVLSRADFEATPIGIGIGQGAAAVTKIVTGRASFVAGEAEFAREIAEMGAMPGIIFSLFRLYLIGYFCVEALARLRDEEPLGLLFIPLVIYSFFTIFEQPTAQGGMVLCTAFGLAALRVKTGRKVSMAYSYDLAPIRRFSEI